MTFFRIVEQGHVGYIKNMSLPSEQIQKISRRRFVYYATFFTLGGGVFMSTKALLGSMRIAKDVEAKTISIKLSDLEHGKIMQINNTIRPMFITLRTHKELEQSQKMDEASLFAKPVKDVMRLRPNFRGELNPYVIVVEAICSSCDNGETLKYVDGPVWKWGCGHCAARFDGVGRLSAQHHGPILENLKIPAYKQGATSLYFTQTD